MHLYALDDKENLISAQEANKQTDYLCRECHGIVRCRGGFLRQMHFYHLEHNRTCRQSGKSILHLQTQDFIQKVLPECTLEKRFSEINRIADVVWEKEKLIFEIQCSTITACEIEERNRDYQSLGYRVIWILHDHLYNKDRLTAAEYILQEVPHYFTNINEDGQGHIYDQCNVIEKGKRVKTVGFREVFLSTYHLVDETLFMHKERPKWMNKRIQSWPLYFSGDYFDHFLTAEESERKNILTPIIPVEEKLNQKTSNFWDKLRGLFHFIAFPYRLTLHLLLDKLTR